MVVKKKKKVSSMQTFDPEDFSAHALDHSIRSKIWPLQRGEKMVRVEKDLDVFQGKESIGTPKTKKSILVSLFGNILMPGLGNIYVRPNPFSISILLLSILVLFVTFSPLFPIVNLLSVVHVTQPNTPEGTVITLFVPESVVVQNQLLLVGPTFSVLIVPFLLSWLHLLYLLTGRARKVEWTL